MKHADRAHKLQSRKSVIVSSVVLLLVIIFFILLSFFIEQRNDNTMAELYEESAAAQTKIEKLQEDNILLVQKNETFAAELESLKSAMAGLEQEHNELKIRTDAEKKTLKEQYDALLEQYTQLKVQLMTPQAGAES
ncbi:MAG: hypothetical protein LBC78_00740 [Oscillospiraceae bacterium]|jgi:peptidoglycan hydrolase CwlO-like protein|nr:hypothetical protein [Oscillospiraceae bacterium]